MDIMLMQRLMLDRTTARTCMLRTGSNHKGQPGWFHQRHCNRSNRAKKKSLKLQETGGTKKGAGTCSQAMTKRDQHKLASTKTCHCLREVWGKQAVLGLLGMCGKQTEQGYTQQGKMTAESETLGWEVSLKQDRWQSQIQPKVPKTRMKLNRAEVSSC